MQATMGLNLEMNTTLAVAAAVTERVKLCTAIAVLPIRNPVLNARQVASIDLYSGGRVLYGVGVGWLREEADAMGMPWDRRGRRVDEQISLLRTLWSATGETVEFAGEFYQLPPISPDPLPVQRPIPILIGGHSDAALDRAARIGDGWIAAGMGPERLKDAMDRLRAACDRAGRDPDELPDRQRRAIGCAARCRISRLQGAGFSGGRRPRHVCIDGRCPHEGWHSGRRRRLGAQDDRVVWKRWCCRRFDDPKPAHTFSPQCPAGNHSSKQRMLPSGSAK